MFVHKWDTEEQWFEGVHYDKEMVFEVYIGFDNIGFDLYSMGLYSKKSIELLCEEYEENPDFIFSKLDWKNLTKEEIVDDFLEELKTGDFENDEEML